MSALIGILGLFVLTAGACGLGECMGTYILGDRAKDKDPQNLGRLTIIATVLLVVGIAMFLWALWYEGGL